MESVSRKFDDKPAVLERVPLLVGLVGSSGSGKTFSALRLATGIQRVTGGDIGFVDTEAKRALHYSTKFKFRHVPFGAPFSPLDYLAAIEHYVSRGVKTIVVDSMSHEHEGPGGVLEEHDEETTRLAAAWKVSRDSAQMSAWAQPKAKRRRLINSILQMEINAVFCFRAKEKIKPVKGGKPMELGWMPIAGEEFVYEMTANCLLYPQCGGVPTWKTDQPGERAIIKLPEQFAGLFAKPHALCEEDGEHMAKWAEGGVVPASQPKPNAWAGIFAKVAALGGPDAQDRILAFVGRSSVEELTNADGNRIVAAGKKVKEGASTFDAEFPKDGSPAEEPSK